MTIVLYQGQLREALLLTDHVAVLRAGELLLETVPRSTVDVVPTPGTSARVLALAARLGYVMVPSLEGDELVERWYRPNGELALTARRPRQTS